jgi:ATP-binding cassette subfamily B protein
LFDVTAGEVLFDGVDVRELDPIALGARIGLVPQKPYLFSGTVASNLRYGKPDATDDELWHALTVAQAADFVRAMPDGLNASIAQGGSNVSGGQRQRLAIARAILRNPPVLILDEATSALDYESERLIQQAIERLAQGRTVITIAHRPSTIKNADRIIVLRDGAILEEGDYASLLARGGAFAELIQAQTLGDDAPAG